MVQYGIDIYGIVSAGGAWNNDGGHNMGRKMPMLLAGAVLNDDRIMEFGDAEQHFVFHEDQQTFFVTQRDIVDPRIWENNNPASPSRPELHIFTQDMLGRPAWGQAHWGLGATLNTAHRRSGANWSLAYREINSSVVMAHVLTARLMGLEEYWNWPALFEYIDLAAEHDGVAHFPLPTSPTNEPHFHMGVISMLPFTARMWNAHRWQNEITRIAVDQTGDYLTIEYNISNLVADVDSAPRANIVVAFFNGERFLNVHVEPIESRNLSVSRLRPQPGNPTTPTITHSYGCSCPYDLWNVNFMTPTCIDHPTVAGVGTVGGIAIPDGATYVRAMMWNPNLGNMSPLGDAAYKNLN